LTLFPSFFKNTKNVMVRLSESWPIVYQHDENELNEGQMFTNMMKKNVYQHDEKKCLPA